jgi:hypothetical protein
MRSLLCREPTPRLRTQLHHGLTFFHPDCTVGPGVSPDRGEHDCEPVEADPLRIRAGNPETPPGSPRGLYRRSGIGKAQALPHPAPKVLLPAQYIRGRKRPQSIAAKLNPERWSILVPVIPTKAGICL